MCMTMQIEMSKPANIALTALFAASFIVLASCNGTNNEDTSSEPTAAAKSTDAQSTDAYSGDDTTSAKAAVERIHTLYNERDLGALYAMATERMRQRITKKDFLGFMKRARNTLGAVRSSNVIEQNALGQGGMQQVVVKVKYENDIGTEQWTLHLGDDEVQWSQFNFDAPALTGKK